MKNKTLTIITLILLLLSIPSCSIFGPQPDNTKPMYGEVPKNEYLKETDRKFIQRSINDFNSIDNASKNFLRMAWAYYGDKDFNTAMRRFNQVWLLNPELPDVYFGFAAVLETQNNKSEAERFYKIAFEKCKDNKQTEDCLMTIAYFR